MIRSTVFLIAIGFVAGLNAQDRDVRATEEGQRVIFDRFTWQRRELAKRLPLDQAWPPEPDISRSFARYGLDKDPPAAIIPVPRKLSPSVYLVGSTITLTYLIDCGPGAVAIVDPGLETNVQSILANVEKAGFSRSSIKWILNTHAHFDHSMADCNFSEVLEQKFSSTKAMSALSRKCSRIFWAIICWLRCVSC